MSFSPGRPIGIHPFRNEPYNRMLVSSLSCWQAIMNSGSQICIIDDAADYRLLLQHIFQYYLPAYSVSLFADGSKFLAALPAWRPQPRLILLDRHMPQLDGHQTLLRLKGDAAYQKIPVVMMSATATEEEINGCYEAGANSFLRKPLDFDSLKAELEKLCRYWLELNQAPTNI